MRELVAIGFMLFAAACVPLLIALFWIEVLTWWHDRRVYLDAATVERDLYPHTSRRRFPS